MARRKRRGEMGSPSLIPLLLVIQLVGRPLRRKEKKVEKKQALL